MPLAVWHAERMTSLLRHESLEGFPTALATPASHIEIPGAQETAQQRNDKHSIVGSTQLIRWFTLGRRKSWEHDLRFFVGSTSEDLRHSDRRHNDAIKRDSWSSAMAFDTNVPPGQCSSIKSFKAEIQAINQRP